MEQALNRFIVFTHELADELQQVLHELHCETASNDDYVEVRERIMNEDRAKLHTEIDRMVEGIYQ